MRKATRRQTQGGPREGQHKDGHERANTKAATRSSHKDGYKKQLSNLGPASCKTMMSRRPLPLMYPQKIGLTARGHLMRQKNCAWKVFQPALHPSPHSST